ncbi:MAG: DUF418 domain-containing protein [Oceanicaulis sp.]
MSEAQAAVRPAPVKAADRYESLDVLRGVAVLGILMVNVQAFMMYFGAYAYPPAQMDVTGANGLAWLVTFTFFEAKFITLFSTMFGAGIMLMVGDKPDASRKIHFSRMRWLLLIGLIHGFVFWFGDILAVYAIVGFIAVFFRTMSVAKLLIWGLLFVTLGTLLVFANVWAMSAFPAALEPTQFGTVPDAETLAMFTEAYQSGFLQSRIVNAIGNGVSLLSQLVGYSPRLLGLMLIGMALYKSGFIQARWSAVVYAVLAVICLGAGLPVLWMLGSEAVAAGFPAETVWRHGGANAALSLVVAFGYASLVMLICKAPWLKLLRLPFAAAGRMAFTNYLTQTFVMVALSTGVFGAALWGEIERVQQVQLVIVVWIVQLIVSPLWLAVFRFGPFEWLWRSLSYGKLQPILKGGGAKPAAA